MYAKVRGTEIYFDVAGMQLRPGKKGFETMPTLFLLHGGPGGDHLRFKLHSAELADVAQLIFIDHRGCGRSKKTKAADYTLENNIEDIEALRKHLGLEKISILGGSYGGMVAQGYAIRYPQHVDKLILAVTAPSYRFIERAKRNLAARGTPKQKAMGNDLFTDKIQSSKGMDKYFSVMETLYSAKAGKSNALKKLYANAKTAFSYEALNTGFNGFLKSFDFIPQLKKIKAPTLVLAGDRDWICDPAESKIIAKHIPNATLKIFKNCSHAIATDAHKEYIQAIQKFMRTTKKK